MGENRNSPTVLLLLSHKSRYSKNTSYIFCTLYNQKELRKLIIRSFFVIMAIINIAFFISTLTLFLIYGILLIAIQFYKNICKVCYFTFGKNAGSILTCFVNVEIVSQQLESCIFHAWLQSHAFFI